jgi:eukaryotic-like serine/threonine-protein kinase
MPKVRHRVVRPRTVDPAEETAVIVEEAGPPGPPPLPPGELPPERELWPWMLVLLALVLAGLAAAYFVSRDDGRKTTSTPTTVVTTVAVVPTKPTPATPKPVAGSRVTVPNVLGIPAATAIKALQRKNLRADVKSVFSTKPSGIVAGQKPSPGARLAKAGTVTLLVSKGGKPEAVPDVVGQSAAQAINVLQAQGFKANLVRVPSTEPAGTVVAQAPKPGQKAAGGSAVRLNVSSGPQQTTTAPSPPSPKKASSPSPKKAAPADTSATIPDVVGRKLKQARKEIRKAGLITEVKYVPSQETEGTVVAQSPKPDSSAKTGDHVLVNVSLGPTPSPQKSVPDVVGEDEATAAADLRAAGFKVEEVIDEPTSDQSQDGVVIDEQPAASTHAPTGSEITIYVGRFSG